ncbi:MAG TPA: YIP1 family protein [Ktedonobacteraceae bacterium]
MAWDPNRGQPNDPNQGQPNDPNSAYGTPSNPYGAPPPQNPYGAPQNPYTPPTENPYAAPPYPNYQGGPGYGPPQSAPLPLGEAIKGLPQQYIKVTTKPGVMTFAEEMGKASWDIVWVQLIALAIITAILSYLHTFISPTFTMPSSSTIDTATLRSLLAGFSLMSIILIPVFFFIGQGILYGLAKAFGGQGKFVTQCYTTLLFSVPIGIVSGIVNLIPIAGALVAFALGIYSIVLNIFSLMAVHRLSGGKATAVVLIPIGVVLLFACALVIFFITLIAAALQHR